jgi:hypothetical protein
MADDLHDVFISYAHADRDWVRSLAADLLRAGLKVGFDEWSVEPGDALPHRLDELLKSRHGVLVVSPASLASKWVREEYAAMLTRTVAGKRRLIPVLLKDAELPPLLASRVYVDFRDAAGVDYEAKLAELVRALTGQAAEGPSEDNRG